MGKAPAFQLYAADFYMDTSSWTPTEVGAYIRLLLAEWTDGPLPPSVGKLARIAGVDVRNFKRMWENTISAKFVPLDTLSTDSLYRQSLQTVSTDTKSLINLRLEETRQKQLKYAESQRIKGEAGADKRWHGDIAAAIAQPCPEDSSSVFSFQSSNSPNTSQDNKGVTPPLSDTPVSDESQPPPKIPKKEIPDCPHSEIIELYHQILPQLPHVNEWGEDQRKILRARWREKKERQSLEWWRSYFGLIRASPWLTGEESDWRADLEWVVRPKNMAKILNGRYHRQGKPQLGKFGARNMAATREFLEGAENEGP